MKGLGFALTYQNLLSCRVPVNPILGFIIIRACFGLQGLGALEGSFKGKPYSSLVGSGFSVKVFRVLP